MLRIFCVVIPGVRCYWLHPQESGAHYVCIPPSDWSSSQLLASYWLMSSSSDHPSSLIMFTSSPKKLLLGSNEEQSATFFPFATRVLFPRITQEKCTFHWSTHLIFFDKKSSDDDSRKVCCFSVFSGWMRLSERVWRRLMRLAWCWSLPDDVLCPFIFHFNVVSDIT